ncbi:MAG: T9SS type A sorting domain-containing protein [Flavobacteriales bacterium]|mgnify:FL=1|jgi:hypothetical protein
MGNDAIGYFFIVLLVLIAAPLVFWIGSVLYAWVKWLFNDKSKLNASYSEMSDFENPVKENITLKYKIGTDSNTRLVLCDNNFLEIKELFNEHKNKGSHTFNLEIDSIKRGSYFLEMTTSNQKITKKISIEN